MTSPVVFEQDGSVQEYVGGYSDWLRRGHNLAETDDPDLIATEKRGPTAHDRGKAKTKLSYKQQRELDALPAKIETLETDIAALQTDVAAPDFYSGDDAAVQAKLLQLSEAEALLVQRTERWGELETLKDSLRPS